MGHSNPRLCGSFAKSASKVGVQYHNAGYRALGLDFTYVAFSIEDIHAAVQAIRTLNIRGVGVTMPYKETVIPLLDYLDPDAARIKAVNTIVNDDGRLSGFNTDWVAARKTLEEVTPLEGKDVVVLGAGGAARAIVYALSTAKAKVRLYNRTVDKAAALVKEFGLTSAHALDELPKVGNYDILINTTSVGYKKPDETPVPDSLIQPGKVIMDIVAEPLETLLLKLAKARGAKTAPGYRMRLLQAGEQFQLYTGVEPPLDVMEAALIKATGG